LRRLLSLMRAKSGGDARLECSCSLIATHADIFVFDRSMAHCFGGKLIGLNENTYT
jgi:hypothetical protein